MIVHPNGTAMAPGDRYRAGLRTSGPCELCPGRADRTDHCHRHGLIRGQLCNSCNVRMGYADRGRPVSLRFRAFRLRCPGCRPPGRSAIRKALDMMLVYNEAFRKWLTA